MSKDKETDQIMSEADALNGMFESSGWAVAEREMNDIVAALRDISTIEDADPNIAVNIQVRKKTALALEEWVDSLKSQVNNVIISQEGIAPQKFIERR